MTNIKDYDYMTSTKNYNDIWDINNRKDLVDNIRRLKAEKFFYIWLLLV